MFISVSLVAGSKLRHSVDAGRYRLITSEHPGIIDDGTTDLFIGKNERPPVADNQSMNGSAFCCTNF
jgi:hypothetical protein